MDPNWAWSPYAPHRSQPWNRRRAAHLFRRAGFGAHSSDLDEAIEREPDEVLQRLLARSPDPAFRENMDDLARAVLAGGEPENLAAWWLYGMLSTPDPLLEKMTLFWHGHFATSAAKVQDAQMMLDQNRLLRRHALGRFGELIQGISRDPAMLVYLDSENNRKVHPNENYARELMELFCLGEGHYTEQDIQQLARCFTGWEVRRRRFRFNRYQHDFGRKTILNHSGPFSGQEAIQIVVDQASCPHFVVRKLIRYFIADEPQASQALIEPLAQEFRDREGDIGWIVKRILGSQLFFSDHAIGRKIRSPVELGVGLLRAFQATTDLYQLAEGLAQIGQQLFYPPNVKGWDGGKAWINSATLIGRVNLVHRLIRHEKTRFARGNFEGLLDKHNIHTPEEIVDWLLELLVAVPIAREDRSHLICLARDSDDDKNQQIAIVVQAISTLPEFQLA